MSGHWPAGRPAGGQARGPFTSWGGPQLGVQHTRQQEIAKKEAQRKRAQQAAQAAEVQKRREGGDLPKDLFAAPTRAATHQESGDVERVFGSFHKAHQGGLIHNTYRDNCFGVDYQPPTPAPAREHIIGEDEEEASGNPGSQLLQGPFQYLKLQST